MADPANLAERIAAGDVVQDDHGGAIMLAWPLLISGTKQITVDYTVTSGRSQLLHVAIRGGTAVANRMTTSAFVIRCDRTPSPVIFEATPKNQAATLYFWNGWSVASIDQAWLGNAGIYEVPSGADSATDGPRHERADEWFEGAPERHRIACSDGVGAVSFTDLTATITVEDRPKNGA